MTLLFDKLILFICCTILMYFQEPHIDLIQIIAFLAAVIFVSLESCFNLDCLPWTELSKKNRFLSAELWAILAALSLIFPAFAFFLPLLLYELTVSFRHPICFTTYLLPLSSFRKGPASCLWIIFFLFLLAWFLASKTTQLFHLEQNLRLLRDTSTEYNLLLQQKNRDLIQNQNHEIHIATLKERNRIAREIHDNVGHMLSRSILQAGALSALNQQENLKEPIAALSQTLSSAMDTVRKSVHDLHDDSVDLKAAVSELISGFSNYPVTLNYDMEPFTPAQMKYCFISIVREALSNFARHSNGTDISITMRAHPSLYQLIIKDNGTNIGIGETGIGILNMKERVKNLNGNFSLSTEHGFQIFVSVPREDNR